MPYDQYDFLRPEVIADPYPLYHRLRVEDPVHWSDTWDCWILTRYADVLSSLRDPRLSNSRRITLYYNQLPETEREEMRPVLRYISTWFGFIDPPDHTRLRSLVSKAFTPRMVEAMRPRTQEIVDKLLDTVQDLNHMDIINDFAYPLPGTVIAEMLGLPPEDGERFKNWAADIRAFLGTGRAKPDEARQAKRTLREMTDYVSGFVAHRRQNPKEDLISALVAVEESGDVLNEEELLGMCVSFLVAGHETTDLIGNSLLALLQNPDQLQRLKTNPTLITAAVEELLRYDSPVQRDWGVATEDIEIGGKRISEGQIVLQMLGAANRDPEEFPEPDRLDLARQGGRHVAFGMGFRSCLGAPLARIEGQVAVNTLLHRMPNLQLADKAFDRHENMAFRSLKSLRITF